MIEVKLTLEQHRTVWVHLHMDFFFNKYCKGVFFYDFLNIFFSLAYFIVRIQHMIHIRKYVLTVYVIAKTMLLVSGRLLIKFFRSQVTHG